ncbi:MAG: ATP-dependent 6-phosphofructokinase [Byssovorax sp.]
MITQADLKVTSLGERTVPSPLGLSTIAGDDIADYVPDDARILFDVDVRGDEPLRRDLRFERAGPRQHIYFDPPKIRAGIVTSGGLCPGINNVIRGIVLELYYKYRVREILGFRYGFEGLDPETAQAPIPLGPEEVSSIHKQGGSILGLSRGKRDIARMADTLRDRGVDILFVIGGDGTLRGAHLIAEELARRGDKRAVIGVPKTIDNDIPFVDKTFGFDTAVELARLAVDAAHTEATGAHHGVGLVKLMGRDAGFIAANATLASADVNFCLIPEVHFDLEGSMGLFAALHRRLLARGHALIVIGEGCGATLSKAENAERDASGNLRYASASLDVGPRLRDAINAHFAALKFPINVKYIDPSYMLRGVPANAADAIFCDALARNAVHAGMAGKTDVVIGRWHRAFTHVPLGLANSEKKRIDSDGSLWLAVTEITGQPPLSNSVVLPSQTRPSWRPPTL